VIAALAIGRVLSLRTSTPAPGDAVSKIEFMPLKKATLSMHRPGTFLMLTHLPTGPQYWVTPNGGRVSEGNAAKIIAQPNVEARDHPLVPGVHGQSWALVSVTP
jgi:hypothetical protein